MRPDLAEAIGNVDDAMLRDAEKKPRPKRAFLLAACFALLFAAAGTAFFFAKRPAVSRPTPHGAILADRAVPCFYGGVIVRVDEWEQLPEVYEDADGNTFYILKLTVAERLSGSDVPDTVCYRYSAWIGSDYFAGCDTLFLSMRQIGAEDYLLTDTTHHTPAFFPMMYEAKIGTAYGDTIRFRNGKAVRPEFLADRGTFRWEEERPLSDYPAAAGESVETVEDRIRRSGRLETQSGYRTASSFVPADVRALVKPNGISLFEHAFCGDYIEYTRVINGFPTTEEIVVHTDGTVEHSGEAFESSELATVPDIQAALDALDLQTMKSPHRTDTASMTKESVTAIGWYTKKDGELYGAVRVLWTYRTKDGAYAADDFYELLLQDGTVKPMEQADIHAVLGESDLRSYHAVDYESTYHVLI